MPVMRALRWGLLLAVMGGITACKKHPAKQAGESGSAERPSAHASSAKPMVEKPRANLGTVWTQEMEEKSPPPKVEQLPAQKDIKVGMTRDEVLDTLGVCAIRVAYTPPLPPAHRSVETFQPRGEPCQQRFGARRFMVVAGKLEEILDGLEEPIKRRANDVKSSSPN